MCDMSVDTRHVYDDPETMEKYKAKLETMKPGNNLDTNLSF